VSGHPHDPEPGPHLSPEDLAVLAEGADRDQAPRELLDHLARCRSCMAAYADVVRYRAGWLAFPKAFTRAKGTVRGRRPGVHAPRALMQGRAALFLAAAGFVVVFVLAGAWLTGRLAPRRPSDPIAALIERASAEGLVIPGGEAGASRQARTYRSGSVVDDEAGRALERMRAEHERAPREHRDVHTLVAGLLASGRVDLAGDYVEEGLARAPEDSRLLTLSAIVAHRTGNLSGAERRLRSALQASPGDATATLDLGIVLAEAGRTDEADSLLGEVIRKVPDSPLADRSRRALSAMPRR